MNDNLIKYYKEIQASRNHLTRIIQVAAKDTSISVEDSSIIIVTLSEIVLSYNNYLHTFNEIHDPYRYKRNSNDL